MAIILRSCESSMDSINDSEIFESEQRVIVPLNTEKCDHCITTVFASTYNNFCSEAGGSFQVGLSTCNLVLDYMDTFLIDMNANTN